MINLRSKSQIAKDWQSFIVDCRKQLRFESNEAVQERARRRRNYANARAELAIIGRVR